MPGPFPAPPTFKGKALGTRLNSFGTLKNEGSAALGDKDKDKAAALSSGDIAASLTGVGIVVGAPAAGVAACTGAALTSLTVLNKNLDRKVDKHSRLLSLATAKHDSINCCVLQAMNDNHISDKEFQLITREMQKYRQLKDTLRSYFVKKPSASPQP